MARRLSAVLLALFGTLLLGMSPASAAPTYPVPGGSISVSASSIGAGGSVTVRACGFAAGSGVSTTNAVGGRVFGGPSGRVGNDGCVSVSFRLTVVGHHVLTVSGTATGGSRGAAVLAAGRSLSVGVDVTGSALSSSSDGGTSPSSGSTSGSSGLPRTGGTLAPLWPGAALLIAGGALIMVTRNRRRAHIAA